MCRNLNICGNLTSVRTKISDPTGNDRLNHNLPAPKTSKPEQVCLCLEHQNIDFLKCAYRLTAGSRGKDDFLLTTGKYDIRALPILGVPFWGSS